MRNFFLISTVAALSMAAYADIPQGYYNSLDGKSGNDLMQAITALAEGHTVIEYGDNGTWPAFQNTDTREIDGKLAWWDMYSNKLVWTEEHSSLNIEHSVANSWWGGKTGSIEAYSDLFHLNPSDAVANGKKSNYPPGIVATADLLDNGLLLVGKATLETGGGSSNVFEPADEYKGDFARAYLYVFSAYPEIPWKEESAYVYDTDNKLQPWAVSLLLSWHKADPVDSKEINRNEEIYKLQNNRNPFIDYPELVDYVWGDKNADSFVLANAVQSVAVDRPQAPAFPEAWMTGVNTYLLRWWNGFHFDAEYEGGTLMLSIDGNNFFNVTDHYVDPAYDANSTHTYKAYVQAKVDGYDLRSSITTLNMVALDPSKTDYSMARWERVTHENPTLGDGYYILVSSNNLHVMGVNGGTSSTAFMPEVGFAKMGETGNMLEIASDAAIVKFEALSGDSEGKYRLMVSDTFGDYKGSWNASAKNKMKLDEVYTPATAEFNENDEFIFTFDQFGSLQFNKQNPRFLNYSSSQTPVYLYRFLDFEDEPEHSAVNEIFQETPWGVGVDGNTIIAPEGSRIFDLNGREVTGKALSSGIYIVVGTGKSVKVRL